MNRKNTLLSSSIVQTQCLNNLISAYRLSCTLDTEVNEKTLAVWKLLVEQPGLESCLRSVFLERSACRVLRELWYL